MTDPTTEECLRRLDKMSEAEMAKLLQTPPHHQRYPNTNQASACYSVYNEFFRCEKFKGKGNKECFYLKQSYLSRCPQEWYQKWDELRKEGNFPGPL